MIAPTSPGTALAANPVGEPHVPRTTWANARAATLSRITTDECDGSAPHSCSTAATSPAPVVRNASPDRASRVAGAGEVAAVEQLCGALPSHSSVVILDKVAARAFAQVVRGTCGSPTGFVTSAAPGEVGAI